MRGFAVGIVVAALAGWLCLADGVQADKLFPLDVDRAMFERQIARNSIPVLVDVWAPWCGPCRMMTPAFEEAARLLEPDLRLIKLNSDEHQEIAARLGIRGIPTLILFAHGYELARTAGAMTTQQIVDWVRSKLPPGS